jgi:hypothetical protein
MIIDRNRHPILTSADLAEFVSQLTNLERKELIDCLDQQLVDNKTVIEINKKIQNIENNVDVARSRAHSAYHSALDKDIEDARHHAHEAYWKAGEALDDVEAIKGHMKSFEG